MEILEGFRGEIHLDGGWLPDLSAMNAMLHAGGGLKMIGGEGRVDLHLVAREPRSAEGAFDLSVAGARFSAGGAEASGDLQVHAALKQGDLVRGVFDVGGTEIALENVVLPDPKREKQEAKEKKREGEVEEGDDDTWWMKLAVNDGTVDVGQPTRIDMTVHFEMKDTRPLLRTFLARPRADGEGDKVPAWARLVPNIRDVDGDASLDMGPQGTVIDDVAITGEKTEIMARLRAHEGRLEGQFYVGHGILHLGVELAGGKKHVKLSKPKQWFIEQPEYDDSMALTPVAEREAGS